MFKLWSELNPKVIEKLKPDLWMKSWDDLTLEEKEKIWKFLEKYFFNYNQLQDLLNKRNLDNYIDEIFGENFINKYKLEEIIQIVIFTINEKYKYNTYAEKYHKDPILLNACFDFYDIFINNNKDIVYELLSIYWKALFLEWEKNNFVNKKEWESSIEYNKRLNNWKYRFLDNFINRLNEVFWDFWLNILLTRQWLIPKQWEKIIEEIYKPTLDFLSDNKWKSVNRELWDAFSDYHKKDFSWSLTHTISAIQWFLQINIDWELSNLSIKDWIKKAKNEWLIPNDIFTNTIFKNIDSIISRERQDKWDPHPKKEYANEQNARLVLNLAMVFMQHFIQIKL